MPAYLHSVGRALQAAYAGVVLPEKAEPGSSSARGKAADPAWLLHEQIAPAT